MGDGLSGFLGAVSGIASHFYPRVGAVIAPWLWQIPLWGFGGVIVWRILSAPYYVWKEEHDRANAADEKAKALESEIVELKSKGRSSGADMRTQQALSEIASGLQNRDSGWRS